MRTLVVTSCTGQKAIARADMLTLEDFRDHQRLRVRETELADSMLPAGSMYNGLQHVRLMDGVRLWRDAFGTQSLDVAIVSAGYGLIPEDRRIAPYEVTFKNMKRTEIVSWARRQRIPEAIRQRVQSYRLAIFLLGDKYIKAIDPPLVPAVSQRFVFLGGSGQTSSLGGRGVTVIPAAREEATKYSEGVVALKGKMFLLFAQGLIRSGIAAWEAVLKDDSPRSFLATMDVVS